ncbi:MAG: methionine synthase, partial [Chloroflexi bacterium]|nr:methionine synthase [Chloroflexota bacterium]
YELNRRELAERWPVLLGGAALTRKYVEWDLRNTFHGDVFYGQDAFEGLRIMNALSDGVTLEREPVEPMPGPTASSGALAKATATAVRSMLAPAATIPSTPFLGTRVIRGLPLTEVFPYINRNALLRGQWGFKGRDAETTARAEQALIDIQQQALREGVLEPAVVYGYFPAQSDGDDLIVFDAEGRGTEAVRFSFPRQQGKQSRCLSDYFRSVDSGEMDLVGFHVVTMGSRVGEYAQELYAADRYQEYLYWHGFGVEIAEALAEYWHRRIRQELGIDGSDGATPEELIKTNYQGARYSFGYPACPNLEDQALLWTLLEPERISVTLSEEFQMHPEQSTSALIVHHPEARYFNI